MVEWLSNDWDEDRDEPDGSFWEPRWEVEDLYQRILVAIDQNPWSQDALTHAVMLASHANARLIILMVPTYLIIQEAPYTWGLAERLSEAIVEESNAVLARAVAAAERAAVPYTTIFRWGSFVPTILHVADAEHCDLIVVGSPVKAVWWSHFLQPSHAKHVAASARQPVLVVKA